MKYNLTIREIRKVLYSWEGPIVVAYSGGKDSSAVLKLVLNAVAGRPKLSRKVTVIYCDTRVENPVLDAFVKRTLRGLKVEAGICAPGLSVKILRPALHQNYFVRVIGRGYPPPTTFFRWCTKDLRIRPVQKFIRRLGRDALVVVGTRRGESSQRDRVLARAGSLSKKGPLIQRQMDGGLETHLYLPIVGYSLDDVWECLADLSVPECIDVHKLAEVYRHGGGECPMIRETNDQPCASARFGCWVCTVVRRDKSAENLLRAGYDDLNAYYDFRTWLSQIRNDLSLRCKRRRNGQVGPGPFKLEARRLILDRVRELERCAGCSLITQVEERYIRRLWDLDRASPTYMDGEDLLAMSVGSEPVLTY